jgi:hypothetical protein
MLDDNQRDYHIALDLRKARRRHYARLGGGSALISSNVSGRHAWDVHSIHFDEGLRNQLTECIGTDFATTTHVLRLLNHPAVGLYIKSSFAEKIRCGDLS